MKMLKVILSLAVSGLLVGAGLAAYAATPSYTFVFEATSGTTALNGSTITIQGDTITSWNLDPVVFTPPTLTSASANSSVTASAITVDASTWDGSFTITETDNPLWSYSGQDTGGSGSLDVYYNGYEIDPPGTWTPLVSVPDAVHSFQLFALALAALGASHLFFRRRSAILG